MVRSKALWNVFFWGNFSWRGEEIGLAIGKWRRILVGQMVYVVCGDVIGLNSCAGHSLQSKPNSSFSSCFLTFFSLDIQVSPTHILLLQYKCFVWLQEFIQHVFIICAPSRILTACHLEFSGDSRQNMIINTTINFIYLKVTWAAMCMIMKFRAYSFLQTSHFLEGNPINRFSLIFFIEYYYYSMNITIITEKI